MTDTDAPTARTLNRGERHAILAALEDLTVPDSRDLWIGALVDGGDWPDQARTVVLTTRGHIAAAEGQLARWAAGTFDYDEPATVEVRITVPARPFTPTEPGRA